MLDQFLKLLDKCIEFLKLKEDINTKAYKKIIAPIMEDFETAHNHFINCFLAYNILIKNSTEKFNANHPVFYKIKEDMLASSSIRSKVVQLYKLNGGPTLHNYSLWQALADYFDVSEELMESLCKEEDHYLKGGFWSQTMGMPPAILSLLNIAKEKTDEKIKVQLALKAIDTSIEAIQINYLRIIEAHASLKLKMLKSK